MQGTLPLLPHGHYKKILPSVRIYWPIFLSSGWAVISVSSKNIKPAHPATPMPPAAKEGSFEKPPPLESPAKLFIKKNNGLYYSDVIIKLALMGRRPQKR